jgi:hypothetical protein
MIAERLAGIALLAYPREVRESRGGEMVGTVLDVSEGSPWRVLGESVALIRSGLRARASIAAGSGSRRLAATVCAQAATVWGLVLLIAYFQLDRMILDSSIAQREGGLFLTQWETGEVALFLTQSLIAASVAVALIGYDRIAALFGLAWTGFSLQQDLSSGVGGWGPPAHVIALLLIPAVCYLVMLLMPRARRRDGQRLLWLAGATLVGLAPSSDFTNFGPDSVRLGGLGLSGMVLLALLLAGLFLLPARSSLPLAFALALLIYGLSLWTLPHRVPLPNETIRWVMTSAGPPLLIIGATLTFASARRRSAG